MLVVAAGGGGDAITASVLAPHLRVTGTPIVTTYSWDRLLVDPLPGPRTTDDFDGLQHLAPDVNEITPATTPRPPAGSTLPRLAAELPARLLLLDPTDGALGMSSQITAAARYFDIEHLALVDVGGDVLAKGDEPRLRSPLADLLALAACCATGLPCDLYIVGPGVDGEIDSATLLERLDQLGAVQIGNVAAGDIAPIRGVFDWHPSEATGILAAAAAGERGSVETRDAANRIDLNDTTTAIYRIDAYKALAHSPVAELRDTVSLGQAAQLVTAATGTDEIGYETSKATRSAQAPSRVPTIETLATADQQATDAAARGATHITIRRLAELAGATGTEAFAAFRQLLVEHRPAHYRPPLYRITPPPD